MGMPTNEYPGYGAPVADFNNLQQQSPNHRPAAALGGMPAQGRDQEGEPMEFDDQHHLSRNRELSGDMMVDAPEVDESSDEEAENRPPGHLEEKSPAPGDEVDLGNIASFYMGMKLDVQDSVGKWSEAEVIGVDVTHSCVEITYLYWADKWNEWIRIDSGRLAAANTQVYVPGGPLRVGMRVEVLDERLQWLEAEVMEVSPCRTEAKVHFRGWKPAFDEWVPRVPGVGSHKVRPYGRLKPVIQRKARYLCGATAAMTGLQRQHSEQTARMNGQVQAAGATAAMTELRRQHNEQVAQLHEQVKAADGMVARLTGQRLDQMTLDEVESLEQDLKGYLTATTQRKEALLRRNLASSACVVCQDNTKTVLILPCRHLCLCQGCSEVEELRTCPMCRENIESKINTFI
mmetsp:Transcript_8744/g.15518  ORF Transcript_8744/g.15518 Transcript_8744/m.15518 type:complete len:403 (-) Transcript_8744:168-1376(-)